MNWYSNVVPPKIKALLKREAPENLWVKCPESGQLVFHKDIEANLYVVPGSGYHMRCPVEARLASLFDDGEYELMPTPEAPTDPLKFRDIKRYVDKLKEYRAKTGRRDAVTVAVGNLEGSPVTVAVQDFEFLGGSLGMAAGEAIVAGMRPCAREAHALHHLHRVGRRAHAGGHVLADADAAHDHRRAAPARGAPALYRRADQSDDRRRHRVLRHARRHADRRARRDHRLRRRARHRADDPREAARRLPARRISASDHGMVDMVVPRQELRDDAGAPVRSADQVARRAAPPPERSEAQPHGSARRDPVATARRFIPRRSTCRWGARSGCSPRSGRPELRLPPIIHVAGTNGKGSTLAFLRAMLEAAGKRVHVYTSPHLLRFNERIRLGADGGGTLVDDER